MCIAPQAMLIKDFLSHRATRSWRLPRRAIHDIVKKQIVSLKTRAAMETVNVLQEEQTVELGESSQVAMAQQNTGEREWTTLGRAVLFVVGLFADVLGLALITEASFGISSVTSVSYALHNAFPAVTFGTWTYLFQTTLVGVLALLSRKIRIRYFLSFVVSVTFGLMLDFVRIYTMMLGHSFFERCLWFGLGAVLLMAGICMVIVSGLPTLPPDMFVNELSQIKGWEFKRVKTTFDIGCVAFSCLIGLIFCGKIVGVGIGTLICACTVGRGVSLIRTLLYKAANRFGWLKEEGV